MRKSKGRRSESESENHHGDEKMVSMRSHKNWAEFSKEKTTETERQSEAWNLERAGSD